jgi:hypothetical protein
MTPQQLLDSDEIVTELDISHLVTAAEGIVRVGQSVWLEGVGLELMLWEGEFEEDVRRLWLRWCDRDGQVIPTGAERAEQAESQLETKRQRAERLGSWI